MALREQFFASHPDFPWLSLDEPEGIRSFLAQRNWLEPGEQILGCEKAGEGNMNLTVRVKTDRRSVIVKQSRPWVEKYDQIAAPWERIEFEERFYDRVSSIPVVSARMPKLLASDPEARTIMLEFLPGARDLTDVYSGARLTDNEICNFAKYIGALHRATAGEADPNFANRAMRELNHAHIFVIPLEHDNGLELESHEEGLDEAANALKGDAAYCQIVREIGERYLAEANNDSCLLHGDYYPGSWLRTAAGPRVIDPEFCFIGDHEFDLGVCVAHFAIGRHTSDEALRLLEVYTSDACGVGFDECLLARYAGIEVMRRLIGVAQLPIEPTRGWRAPLLERSRNAVLEGRIDALWS